MIKALKIEIPHINANCTKKVIYIALSKHFKCRFLMNKKKVKHYQSSQIKLKINLIHVDIRFINIAELFVRVGIAVLKL